MPLGDASGPGRGGREARRADARRAAGAGSTRRVAPVEPARRGTGRPGARRDVGNRVGDAHGAPRRVSAATGGSRTRIAASPVRGRFAVEDCQGTVLAIQDEWKRGKRSKNVLDACARIDAFLDNPLLVDDEARAAATVQRIARGWLLRRARTRGALLFPVEAQALADGRVLMHNHYGARIYSMGPAERRRLVTEHWAARRLQRMFGRQRRAAAAGHGDPCASPQPEPSFFSVGPDDSLLFDFSPRESCEGLLHGATGVQQAAHAAGVLQPRGAAALRLQACWRGASCRLRARLYRASRAGAAVALQKTFRGWLCRRRIERLQQRVLMKRALGLWNKVMWTVYSPGRRCVGYDLTPSTGQYGGCAVDCEPAAASTPVHTNLSAAMDIEEEDAVVQETPRDVSAQTVRQSWRVEPDRHAGQCGALARGGPSRAVAQTHAQAQWPDTYTRSMCFEPGALAQAIAMDSGAVLIQRAVRAYLSGTRAGALGTRVGSLHRAGNRAGKFQPVLNEPAGPSHATPPGGGPAIQGGGTNAGASLAADVARGGAGAGAGAASSPARSTPPSPALPPATPVLAGTGCEREQVLSAWKKGIETQVSIIHEKLVDSARKGSSARSRSRSPLPPPSAAGSSKPLLVGAASRPPCSPLRSGTSSPALSPPETPSNVFRGAGESTERALRCRLVPCLPLQREPRTPDKALSGDEDELAACGARHGTGSSGRASRAATCPRSPCVASPVKVSGKRATGTGSACFLQDPPAPGRPSSFQRACELDGEAIKMSALPALQL